MTLWIDVEDSLGNKLGDGPIVSAAHWSNTASLDRCGKFSFEIPASDPKAVLVQRKRIVRAYTMLNGQSVAVGSGVIDVVERQPKANGDVTLRVSGGDLLRELTYRSVLNLKLYLGGNPVSHASAISAIAAFAPPGWTFTPDTTPRNPLIYGQFNGETVLACIVKTADKNGTHFVGGTDRTAVFRSTFVDSGIRAIEAAGDLQPETCAIVALKEQTDTTDVITRIYPRGSGNADVQLTLRATTRTAPAGYVLNAAQNYIENTAATATYGRIERQLDYREIGPVANTAADIQSAANALFDAALEELRRAVALEQATYTLSVAGCSAILRPMQTVRVVYRDSLSGLNVDADLNILEATIQVDASGVQTTGLTVSTSDRWAQDDTTAIIGSITEGRTYQALPQLNANSYVTAYQKNVDASNIAAFRFRFGKEVTQLQQVSFEFQLLPFESTITGVGMSSTTGGSGQLETDGPSTDTSGSPSNNTSGAAAGNTGAAAGSTGAAAGNTGAAAGSTGAAAGNTGAAAGNTGAATGNTGSGGAGNTGSGGAGNTSNGGAGNTGSPTGGDTISAGRHQHTIGVTLGATVTYPIGYGAAGTAGGLVSSAPGSTHNYPTNQQGDHVHAMTNHTHPVSDHIHSVGAHTHTVDSHAHTLNSHTHDLASHAHTLNSHTHDMNSHTHGMNAHTHDLGGHAHSLNAHTHSLSNHKHTFTPVIDMRYGIFRDSAGNLTPLSSLQYRVNGGSWSPLTDAVAGAGGWYLLDITAKVQDSVTLRPLQDDNLLEIGAVAPASGSIAFWAVPPTSGSYFIDVHTGYTPNGIVVGDIMQIASNISVDGLWVVAFVDALASLIGLNPYRWTPSISSGFGVAGSITGPLNRRATIDAQLAVRNVVQAIAYA